MTKISETRSSPALSRVQLGALLIILVGLVFRLRQYAAQRSLWLDEVMLARNIVERSFSQLAQPLDYNQGAPLGFLYIEKLLTEILGNRDYILRLLPLLAGCFSLYLMYRLASYCIRGPSTFVALALFALSDRLIYYTSEFKQYSIDVLIVLLLYLAAAPDLEGRATRKHHLLLTFGGAIALWVAHPAAFVLASIGFALFLLYLVRRDWGMLRWFTLSGLVWIGSFGLLYLASLRHLTASRELLDFWQPAFMPMPPWANLRWLIDALRYLFVDPAGLSASLVGALLGLTGAILLVRQRWLWGVALFFPLILTLMASGLHVYPFGGRLLLFVVPSLLIAVAVGLEGVRSALQRTGAFAIGVWAVLVVVLLWGPAVNAADKFLKPPMGEHIRPAFAYVQAHRQPDDIIYVYYGAEHAFRYYASMFGFDLSDYVRGTYARLNPRKYLDDIEALRGKGRVWLFFTHVHTGGEGNEEAFIVENLVRFGTKADEIKLPDASAYLFVMDK
jgi:hypothetical protein